MNPLTYIEDFGHKSDVRPVVMHVYDPSITGYRPASINDLGGSSSPAYGLTSTVTGVAVSGASQSLLPANPYRLGAYIYNNSSDSIYVKLGTTASISSFSFIIEAQGGYQLPMNFFRGQVDCIWENTNASGNALVTEISTPTAN